jgi:hypothetical protein
MDELVARLSKGGHPVIVALRPERSLEAFRECLDRKYVHIRFTGTRGGTELGFTLDPDRCDYSDADFERGCGSVRVAGELTLNYVRVRCTADIALGSLAGEGRLETLEPSPSDSV